MKKFLCSLILLLTGCTYMSAQTITAGDSTVTMQVLLNENLPLIVINTVDGEEPSFDIAVSPEEGIGNSITNVTKVHSRIYILLGNDTLYDSGDYEKDKSGMTIKVRGNSGAITALKNSYKMKLQKKADLLCRDNDSIYKDKEWILNADEENLTNSMTGLTASKVMDFAWTPAFEYANVVMNGAYRGIYMLIESVKRDSKCRINVDKDTGYILQYDPYYWTEDLYFDSSLNYKYTFKYPDSEDVTEEQLEYIRNAVSNMETSLNNETYPEYIDVNTFASWCLTHDLLGTSDAIGSNMFLSKYDDTDTTKFKMETPWDFDSIEETPDDWANIHSSTDFYFSKLFNNSNSEFTDEFIKIWKEKGDSIVDKIIEKLDSIEISGIVPALDYYSALDKKIDALNYDSVATQIETHKQWFRDRKAWLDNEIAVLSGDTGILAVPYSNPDSNAIYDLQGRKVLNPAPGIYIKNGKKYIVK
ncbi:MAG: CotH kinase family protein [Clostridia bacterium]|nr:CotH kinase family protein [Clostridia bacterium]